MTCYGNFNDPNLIFIHSYSLLLLNKVLHEDAHQIQLIYFIVLFQRYLTRELI